MQRAGMVSHSVAYLESVRTDCTYDPLILHTRWLDNVWLLELLGTSHFLLLAKHVAAQDKVGPANDDGEADDVDRDELKVKPVLRGLNHLHLATVRVDAVLLAGLLVVDQQAELDLKLLRLELRDEVKRKMRCFAKHGSERTRLERRGGHVAQHAPTLSIHLVRIEESAGDRLECKQTILLPLLGGIDDREDDRVGLAVLDNCTKR